MALKQVRCCDLCDGRESDSNKIKSVVFDDLAEGEYCLSCAAKKLGELFGVENYVGPDEKKTELPNSEPEVSPDTAAFLKRKGELMTQLNTSEIYVVKPKVPVSPGVVIEYGNPPRNVEIIESFEGHLGEFWAKIVGAIT